MTEGVQRALREIYSWLWQGSQDSAAAAEDRGGGQGAWSALGNAVAVVANLQQLLQKVRRHKVKATLAGVAMWEQ